MKKTIYLSDLSELEIEWYKELSNFMDRARTIASIRPSVLLNIERYAAIRYYNGDLSSCTIAGMCGYRTSSAVLADLNFYLHRFEFEIRRINYYLNEKKPIFDFKKYSEDMRTVKDWNTITFKEREKYVH